MEDTQLEFAQQLCDEHRPSNHTGAQRMVRNYAPKWFRDRVPALYSQEGEKNPIIWRKFFLPEGRWTFYVIEYSEKAPDGTPHLFYGYLASPLGPDCDELGYLTLEQIQELRSPHGLSVETDLWWRPVRLSTLKAKLYPEKEEEPAPTPTPAPDYDSLDKQAEHIKKQQGEPCTVVVGAGKILGYIIPAELYQRFQIYHKQIPEMDTREWRLEADDIAARHLFLNGELSDSEWAADFRRFCRVALQNSVVGRTDPDDWYTAYENDADFAASPGWQNWVPFIGEKPKPEPKFDTGDYVHFGWADDPYAETHYIMSREWRPYEETWAYKASGKWWGEKGLIAAEEPPFKKGEQVWWYEKGPGARVGTGVVLYTPSPDSETVSGKCNERHITGGVVVDQVRHIPLDDLHKGDGPTQLSLF